MKEVKSILNAILKKSKGDYLIKANQVSRLIDKGETSLSAIRTVLNERFLKKYVVIKGGRKLNFVSYFEMLVRTDYLNTHIDAIKDNLKQNEEDLIITSQHADTSLLCEPYQNRILSVSGKSKKYLSLDVAISGGYHHPNCRHLDFPYYEGFTEKPPELSKKEIANNREVRSKQRELERKIRSEKIKKELGIENEVTRYQKEMRDLLKENPNFNRSRWREQI